MQCTTSARQNEGPTIKQAESALAVAQAQLSALTSGPSASDRAAARRAVQRAELAIEEAAQGADPELDKNVATAELNVENIQAQLDAGQIHAPFDGKIASIDVRPGDAVQAYKGVISVMNEPSEPLFAHPVAWAPFVLVGEPRIN